MAEPAPALVDTVRRSNHGREAGTRMKASAVPHAQEKKWGPSKASEARRRSIGRNLACHGCHGRHSCDTATLGPTSFRHRCRAETRPTSRPRAARRRPPRPTHRCASGPAPAWRVLLGRRTLTQCRRRAAGKRRSDGLRGGTATTRTRTRTPRTMMVSGKHASDGSRQRGHRTGVCGSLPHVVLGQGKTGQGRTKHGSGRPGGLVRHRDHQAFTHLRRN